MVFFPEPETSVPVSKRAINAAQSSIVGTACVPLGDDGFGVYATAEQQCKELPDLEAPGQGQLSQTWATLQGRVTEAFGGVATPKQQLARSHDAKVDEFVAASRSALKK
eukprot:31432-Alexandrium_andersonii.AAC.1